MAGSVGEVGVGGGEGGEVVGAEKMGGGGVHGGELEGVTAVPDEGGEEGRADIDVGGVLAGGEGVGGVRAAKVYAVLVGFGLGGVAGVEGVGGVFKGEDADAGGKDAIESAVEVGGGDGGAEGEGGDLGEGVDAGVSAAGALGEDRLGGDVGDGAGEGSLDGGQAGLDLPAVEGCAVVDESGFEVHALT